ncbi:MAG: hypothetical protein R6U46_00610 [Marinilabilia sp.]
MNEELFGKKETPFKVPENYFEDFEDRLMEEIREEATSEKRGRLAPVFSVVKPWLAMAGGFLLIALIYHQAPRLFDQENEDQEVAVELDGDEEFINSLAFIVDENDINELILSEDSSIVLPPDTFYLQTFTEEELASLTYFDY